jgi:hypothetical protein
MMTLRQMSALTVVRAREKFVVSGRMVGSPGIPAVRPHPTNRRSRTCRATASRRRSRSPEFAQLWEAHEVATTHGHEKRLRHPEVGVMDLQCQILHNLEQGQVLLVFTATPGTESYDKLQLLSVMGTQRITPDR